METFILTIRRELLKISLAIAVMLRMIVTQIDDIGAYLESAISQNK